MAARVKGNLPEEVTSFVGREREAADVKRLFSRTKLLTLTGPGGVGKSRLALNAAGRLTRALPGGAWLVDLAPLKAGDLVPREVLRALGLDPAPRESPEECLTRSIASGTLLLLDNCEHLVDACASLATVLLERRADVSLLVTSREALGVGGELTLAVAPLEPPAEGRGLTAMEALESEAVKLFADRAAAAKSDFAVTDANAGCVSEICRRLDGLPLGLELAAVRVRTLALDQLAARLSEQLSLRNLSARLSDPRHRTLGATLDWSHALLAEDERVLWHRLSVFSGGFTIDATEVVCADGLVPAAAILELLSALVEKSIVTPQSVDEGRYRLLEPIRIYGRERLRESGEEARLVASHARWCMDLASSGLWWEGRGQLEWLGAIREDEANIRAALDAAIGGGLGADEALELLYLTWLPWFIGGSYGWARGYAEELLERPDLSVTARAHGLLTVGFAARKQGDQATAERCLTECRVLVGRRRNLLRERAFATAGLAGIRLNQGKAVRQSLETLKECVALLEESGAPVMRSGFLAMVAHYAWNVSTASTDAELEECRTDVANWLRLEADRDDCWGRALVLTQLGVIDWILGNADEGERSLRESLRLQRSIGHRWGMAANLEALAWVAASTGRAERAVRLMLASEELWLALGARLPTSNQARAGFREHCDETCRAELDPSRYATLRNCVTGLDEAVSLALDEAAPSPAVAAPPEWEPLTPREAEVAQLVAQGATNREVAASLMLSDYTVKTHVRHIMEKLGFHSRVEIAGWLAKRR